MNEMMFTSSSESQSEKKQMAGWKGGGNKIHGDTEVWWWLTSKLYHCVPDVECTVKVKGSH